MLLARIARLTCPARMLSQERSIEMNARELYYLNHHLDRLLAWQIAQVESELREIRAARRERIRVLRRAYKNWRLGINRVIADNVACYNRAIVRGY